MTDEQKAKIESFDDQQLLIELAIAFGCSSNIELGAWAKYQIMNIFDKLNLDHINDLP